MKNWTIEFDEMGGYDCMTSAFRVGSALLDGQEYGQTSCDPLTFEQLQEMTQDARLIAAAPFLLEAVIQLINAFPVSANQKQADSIIAASIAVNKALDQP